MIEDGTADQLDYPEASPSVDMLDTPLAGVIGPDAAAVPYVDDLRRCMTALRSSLNAVLSAAVGALPSSGAEVRHELGVDGKLACLLFDASRASDDLAFAACLPSPKRLLTAAVAAERAGVAIDLVRAFRDATHRFTRFIDERAGSRWQFDAILGCMREGPGAASPSTLELRRAAMQAAAQRFGAAVSTVAKVTLIGPDRSEHDRFDLAWIAAHLGVQRLRPHMRIPLLGRRFSTTPSLGREPVSVPPPAPIFPEAASGPPGAYLVSEHCDPPTPRIDVVTTPGGITVYELAGAEVGRASGHDLLTASISPEAVPAKETDGPEANRYRISSRVMHACERYAFAVGYPLGLVSDEPPECFLRTDRFPELSGYDSAPPQPLVSTAVADDPYLESLEIPKVSRTLEASFERLGWDPARFTFFVFDERYPSPTSIIDFRVAMKQ